MEYTYLEICLVRYFRFLSLTAELTNYFKKDVTVCNQCNGDDES